MQRRRLDPRAMMSSGSPASAAPGPAPTLWLGLAIFYMCWTYWPAQGLLTSVMIIIFRYQNTYNSA